MNRSKVNAASPRIYLGPASFRTATFAEAAGIMRFAAAGVSRLRPPATVPGPARLLAHLRSTLISPN